MQIKDLHRALWRLGNDVSVEEVSKSVEISGADEDRSGTIDFREFCQVLSNPHPKSDPNPILDCF